MKKIIICSIVFLLLVSLLFVTKIRFNIHIFSEDMNEQLLHYVRVKDYSNTEILLKNGANVNYRDKFKRTALFYAVTASDYRIAELLLKNKADVNMLYDDEENLLHVAVVYHAHFYHALDIIDLLLSKGIEINHRDQYGNTPLLAACTEWAANLPVIDLLLKNGADMNIKNNYGLAPYTFAVQNDVKELKDRFDSYR